MGFIEYWESARSDIDQYLLAKASIFTHFENEMRRALEGGKRVRGTLTLLVCDALGGKREDALDRAAAIEFVQASSFPADAKVWINSGVKEISKLTRNEMVYAMELGRPTKAQVQNVLCTGIDDIYELTTNTRKIRATVSHKFLTIERYKPSSETIKKYSTKQLQSKFMVSITTAKRWKRSTSQRSKWRFKQGTIPLTRYRLSWKTLGELKKGDPLIIMKQMPDMGKPYKLPPIGKIRYSRKNVHIPKETTDDFMEICGIIMGDGSINRHSVSVYHPLDDRERINYYKELIQSVFHTYVYENKSHGCVIVINSMRISKLFTLLGFNRPAPQKRIPEWIFTLPRKQKVAFVKGLMETDGWNGLSVGFASASEGLVQDVKRLMETLGMHVSHVYSGVVNNKWKNSIKKQSTIYRIKIGQASARDILGYPRSNTLDFDFGRPTIKRTGLLDPNFFGVEHVKLIKMVGTEPVFDIQTGKRNFVVDGFVVHNSLIHDDFIDGDEVRRGRPALWVELDPRRAILLADVLFASAQLQMQEQSKEDGKILAEAIRDVAYGATIETLGDYKTQVIPKKTGALFAAAAKFGAIAAKSSKDIVDRSYRYGMLVGSAFQLADDVTDIRHFQSGEFNMWTALKLFPMFLRASFFQGGLKEEHKKLLTEIDEKVDSAISELSVFPQNDYTTMLREAPKQIIQLLYERG